MGLLIKNKSTKVVLISGKARSGKDTLAENLSKRLRMCGERVLVIHYADYLKYICEKYYDWDGKKDEKGRTLLQTVGTQYRKKNPDFWVNRVVEIIDRESDNYDIVLIPDVRYFNEIKIMEEFFDCMKIKIFSERENDELTKEQKNHETEKALDSYEDFDLVVLNNGTIEEYYNKVSSVLREILIKFGEIKRVI